MFNIFRCKHRRKYISSYKEFNNPSNDIKVFYRCIKCDELLDDEILTEEQFVKKKRELSGLPEPTQKVPMPKIKPPRLMSNEEIFEKLKYLSKEFIHNGNCIHDCEICHLNENLLNNNKSKIDLCEILSMIYEKYDL